MTKNTKARGPRGGARGALVSRLAIWVIFGTLVAGAMAFSGGLHVTKSGAVSGASAGGTNAPFVLASGFVGTPGPTTTLPAAGPSGTFNLSASVGPNTLVCTDTSDSGAKVACAGDSASNPDGYTSNPEALLPAWRWASATGMQEATGNIPNPVGLFFTSIGQLMFSISGWMWRFLLAIIGWAMGMNLVGAMATEINRGFSIFFAALAGPGAVAIWLVIVLGIIMIVRQAMRGQMGKIFSTILVVLVPLAAMTALDFYATGDTSGVVSSSTSASVSVPSSGTAAAVAAANQCGVASIPVGSPAWVACEGTGYLNTISFDLSTGLGMWGGALGGASSALGGGGTDTSPTCAAYVATLDQQYESYATAATETDPGTGSNVTVTPVANTGYDPALVTTSNLWEQGFLVNWVDAQFGSLNQGIDMYCHAMENNAGINATEQKALFVSSASLESGGGASLASAYNAVPVGDFTNLVNTGGNDNNRQAIDETVAWAVCAYSGGSWVPRNAGWEDDYQATNSGGSSSQMTTDCPQWFVNGKGAGGDYGIDDVYAIAGNKGQVPPNPTAVDLQDQAAEGGLLGHDTSQIFLDGLLTFLTTLVYLFALGGLAVGSVIAQIGLVLLLAILPVTLLLLAVPQKGGGRIQAGVRLFKMTLGFFVAKLTLTLTILVLLETIQLLDTLTSSGGSGVMESILTGVIPLACVYLLRKILKAAGMGNIMSLGGAVAMPLAAALSASGETGMRDKALSRWNNTRVGRALGKADGGRLGTWAPKKLGRASLAASKWGTKKLAKAAVAQTGLDKPWRAFMGRKNKDGQVTEYGARQRLGSLHGVLDLARKNRGTGRFVTDVLGTKVGAAVWKKAEVRDRMKGERADNFKMQQADERRALDRYVGNAHGRELRQKMAVFYEARAKVVLDCPDGVRDTDGRLVLHTTIDDRGNKVSKPVYGYDLIGGREREAPSWEKLRNDNGGVIDAINNLAGSMGDNLSRLRHDIPDDLADMVSRFKEGSKPVFRVRDSGLITVHNFGQTKSG